MYVAPNVLTSIGRMLRGQLTMAVNQRSYASVAASQTIYDGDILVVTGGAGVLTVQQSIAAPSAGSATLSGGSLVPYAVALENITTNASGVEAITGKTQISIAVFDPNLMIALRIYNATAANAELQDLVLNGIYQFARYTPTTGNPFYCLSTTTTTGELTYREPYAGSAQTDDFGVAWCSKTALGS